MNHFSIKRRSTDLIWLSGILLLTGCGDESTQSDADSLNAGGTSSIGGASAIGGTSAIDGTGGAPANKSSVGGSGDDAANSGGQSSSSAGVGAQDGVGGDASSAVGGATTGSSASGGAVAVGSGGSTNLGSCDQEFSCPEAGDICYLEERGEGCVKVCAPGDTDILETLGSVTDLGKLGCQVIDGSLLMGGDLVTSLEALDTVEEVTGVIEFIFFQGFDLFTLPNLKSVGVAIRVIETEIVMIDLPRLESVGEFIMLYNNDKLTHVQMDSLRTVPDFHVGQNKQLITLGGLPALESPSALSGSLNPKLARCEFFGINNPDKACDCEADDSPAICQ